MVVAVEVPLPEHGCSDGSKPRWIWGPLWLFLMVENPAGPKKDFFVKKWVYGGPHLIVRIERNGGAVARALLQQWKQNWVILGAFLAAFDSCNSSWGEKINFVKMGGTPKLHFWGLFFTQIF